MGFVTLIPSCSSLPILAPCSMKQHALPPVMAGVGSSLRPWRWDSIMVGHCGSVPSAMLAGSSTPRLTSWASF